MESKLEISVLQFTPLTSITLPFANPTEQTIAELTKANKPLIRQLYQDIEDKKDSHDLEVEVRARMALRRDKCLYEFIQAINQEIEEFNHLIAQYNQAQSVEVKAKVLQQIKQKNTEMDARYPESVITRCPEYMQQFYTRLNTELQNNTRQLTQLQANISVQTYQYRLSELLEKMPQEKLNRFLEMMCNWNKINLDAALSSLYDPTDPEYEEFNEFLSTHTINYAGGNNSLNFQIKLMQSDALPYVLKIENRINQPKDIADDLQTRVDKIKTGEFSRRAYFTRTNQYGEQTILTRSIKTQPFYPEGSLYDYAMNHRRPTEKIQAAIKVYTDMAHILREIDQAGGVFPDMKNSNWMIHEGELIIADDKSFRIKNADGTIDVFSERSQWYGDVVRSKYYMPPEVDKMKPMLAEPFHVYTWGKNLYEFLTMSSKQNSLTLEEGTDFDFSDPIFSWDPEGIIFQQLIKDTVQADPKRRISLQECVTRLERIPLLNTLRDKIYAINTTPIPMEIMSQYLQSVAGLNNTELMQFTHNLNPESLQTSLENLIAEYRTEYQHKFGRIFQEMNSILEKCPNDDLREAILAAKMEQHSLNLMGYEQFYSDLESLLSEANQMLEADSNPESSLGHDSKL